MFRERTANSRYPSAMIAHIDLIKGDARERARPVVVPAWWLDMARELAAKEGCGLVELGRRLADIVKRDAPWNHGTLSKFLATG